MCTNYFPLQKKKMLQNTAKRLIQNFIYDQGYDNSIEIKCIEIQTGYTAGNITFLSKNMRIKDDFIDDFIDELNTKFSDKLGIYKKTKNVIENTDCYHITYGMWFTPESIKREMKSTSRKYEEEDQEDDDDDDIEEDHYNRQKRNIKKKKYSKSICSSICFNCEIMIVLIVCILLCIIFGIIFFKN